ncbi:hypothetical protein [Candidatus Absconditicoccus praedator]|uniref:hypothetical protein n=1 Tax=Candidatus Absconditicoccus praedator TaxID=2735562 RepID=UPI001E314E76|nr:hypothetical protein [Candidatus Absconditicoccus praedator]UFX82629.1 hypothetical protein HLG78_00555 [Candidatus Absconditicoccus praedator]
MSKGVNTGLANKFDGYSETYVDISELPKGCADEIANTIQHDPEKDILTREELEALGFRVVRRSSK